MKKILTLSIFFSLLPTLVFAQGLTEYITSITRFILGYIIPFIIGVAFLFAIINIVRYFILEGANSEGREKAKIYTIYSVAAFVLFIVFFGIVSLLVDTIGFTEAERNAALPDYNEAFGLPSTAGGSGGSGSGSSGAPPPSGPGFYPSP